MSNFLITGGTGSIGSQIVRRLHADGQHDIRVYSRSEELQLNLMRELERPENIQWIIGDVRDYDRLASVMAGCNAVVHAAAMKHVGFCENNPDEAVATNVRGTQNCLRAAVANGVQRFTLVSTDKAAYPANTMGVTKLMAERLVLAAKRAGYNAVRLGNVFGSRGSVVPYLRECALEGRSPRLSHLEVRRFFMTVDEAAEFALTVTRGVLSDTHGIFAPRLGIIRLGDLWEAVKRQAAPMQAEPTIIGLAPGEKMNETLLTAEEVTQCAGFPWGYQIYPERPAGYAHGGGVTTDQDTGLYTVDQIVSKFLV